MYLNEYNIISACGVPLRLVPHKALSLQSFSDYSLLMSDVKVAHHR